MFCFFCKLIYAIVNVSNISTFAEYAGDMVAGDISKFIKLKPCFSQANHTKMISDSFIDYNCLGSEGSNIK